MPADKRRRSDVTRRRRGRHSRDDSEARNAEHEARVVEVDHVGGDELTSYGALHRLAEEHHHLLQHVVLAHRLHRHHRRHVAVCA